MAFAHCKVKVGAAGDDDVGPAANDSPLDWAAHGLAARCERSLARRRAARKARSRSRRLISAASSSRCRTRKSARWPNCATQLGVPMMLDESLTSMADARGGDRRPDVRPVQHPLVEVRRLSGQPATGGAGARGRPRLSTRLPSGRIGRAFGGRPTLGVLAWPTFATSKARTIATCSAGC